MTGKIPAAATILVGVLLFAVSAVPVPAQSVRNPTAGTLDDPLLAPADGETGLQIPFVDMQLRAPDGGAEVALSLRLLLMLAVLSLAPSMICLLYTSPSPRDRTRSRMPSSA